MKVVIIVLGSHASGKSTLSRELLVQANESYVVVSGENIKVSFGAGGISLAGNLKNGSDSIRRIVLLKQTVKLLIWQSDAVLVDGFRSSYKFTKFIQELPLTDLAAVFVHLHISLQENIRRLAERRRKNGIVEDTLPLKTVANLLRSRQRAWAVFDQARRTYKRQPVTFVTLGEELTPVRSRRPSATSNTSPSDASNGCLNDKSALRVVRWRI
ncbi:MAG: hypothetical protein JWO20_3124 [Candidatus Angelobacter sp.]|nr:hypothetical protein [Candidatus Angelobacter sp.]